MLPHIFDLFMQADKSTERTRSGLGIGLTLVRRLVEMHGGTVRARSNGPGKGSEFTVRLPVKRASDTDTEMKPDAQGDTPSPQQLRVLIVEDNRDAAEMLEEMLNAWGQDTRVAYDGLAAVEAAGQFRPQVVLLDIGLPELNGYDVARRIREQPWGQHMSLVAVTGWGQEADRQRSAAAGINHHLIKPVEPTVLKELLTGFHPRRPSALAGGT
jgi:CheY-like chemotaxis protein